MSRNLLRKRVKRVKHAVHPSNPLFDDPILLNTAHPKDNNNESFERKAWIWQIVAGRCEIEDLLRLARLCRSARYHIRWNFPSWESTTIYMRDGAVQLSRNVSHHTRPRGTNVFYFRELLRMVRTVELNNIEYLTNNSRRTVNVLQEIIGKKHPHCMAHVTGFKGWLSLGDLENLTKSSLLIPHRVRILHIELNGEERIPELDQFKKLDQLKIGSRKTNSNPVLLLSMRQILNLLSKVSILEIDGCQINVVEDDPLIEADLLTGDRNKTLKLRDISFLSNPTLFYEKLRILAPILDMLHLHNFPVDPWMQTLNLFLKDHDNCYNTTFCSRKMAAHLDEPYKRNTFIMIIDMCAKIESFVGHSNQFGYLRHKEAHRELTNLHLKSQFHSLDEIRSILSDLPLLARFQFTCLKGDLVSNAPDCNPFERFALILSSRLKILKFTLVASVQNIVDLLRSLSLYKQLDTLSVKRTLGTMYFDSTLNFHFLLGSTNWIQFIPRTLKELELNDIMLQTEEEESLRDKIFSHCPYLPTVRLFYRTWIRDDDSSI